MLHYTVRVVHSQAYTTLWNTLPVHVQSSPSIATFRQRLKTFLFQQSFPDIIIWHY